MENCPFAENGILDVIQSFRVFFLGATVVTNVLEFFVFIVNSKNFAKILESEKLLKPQNSEKKDKKQTPYNLDVLCEI